MNETVKVLVFLLFICGIIIFLIEFSYYVNARYYDDCLNQTGTKFCVQNNSTLYSFYNDGFSCRSDINPRLGKYGKVSYFYFLPEELNECMNKKPFSWRRLK